MTSGCKDKTILVGVMQFFKNFFSGSFDSHKFILMRLCNCKKTRVNALYLIDFSRLCQTYNVIKLKKCEKKKISLIPR